MITQKLPVFVLLLFVFSFTTFAQVDNPYKPEAGPAPKAALPKYKEATLDNGLKIILVTNNKQPLVRFRLMFKSGAEFDNGTGAADFTASMLTKGTKKRTAQQFAEESEFIGVNIGASSSDDDMYMSASGLKKYADKMLEMMTDALMNPVFPQEELDKMIKQTVSGLKTAEKNPEAISSRLDITVGFNDHPYSNFQTEESVKGVTRESLINFHKTYYIPNNASLAVIGDVTMDEVLPLIKKYFSKWQKGTIPQRNFTAPKPITGKTVHLVDLGKTQTQTQIEVITNGMKRNNPDYIAMSLANSILGGGFSGRLFQNLREQHSFTYGAYSGMDSRVDCGLWGASAGVRRSATDSAIIEVMKEMQRMCDTAVSADLLKMHQQYASGIFLLSLENPGTMASRLQAIDLYNLPKDYYNTLVPNMMKVTPADIQRVAKKYLNPANVAITAVGDAAEIKPALERLGPVQMYDTDMNPVDDQPNLEIDIDAETLIQKYIDAKGGKAALENIKDRTIEGDMVMSVQGMEIEGSLFKVEAYPNKSHELSVLSLPNQQLTSEGWCNGKSVTALSPGAPEPKTFEGDMLAKALESKNFNELIRIKELGYTAKVTEKKVMDGKVVYGLEVTKKHGSETWYIDAETYLLNGALVLTETDAGTMSVSSTFSDYRKVDGVMIPFKSAVDANSTHVATTITSVKHNTNPPASEFEPN